MCDVPPVEGPPSALLLSRSQSHERSRSGYEAANANQRIPC